MSQGSSSSGGGITFLGALALLFIGLKLGGVVDWSWWWVLAPLWGPLAAALAILAIIGILFLIAAGIDRLQRHAKKRRRANATE